MTRRGFASCVQQEQPVASGLLLLSRPVGRDPLKQRDQLPKLAGKAQLSVRFALSLQRVEPTDQSHTRLYPQSLVSYGPT